MADMAQEDQFSRRRLSGSSWFSQQTFTETRAMSKMRRFRTFPPLPANTLNGHSWVTPVDGRVDREAVIRARL